MNEIDRSATEEANRLYWDSSASVAVIAQRMGWSRRALYDAIEPLPTEESCETCGSPLVYANRSARSSGTMTCIACEAREEAAEPASDPQLQRALAAEARDRRERIYAAGAAALVGATTGAALTFLLVRRR